MSGPSMSWARQQRTGNATAKAVLLLLGELVNDEGITTKSQQDIADIIECNRATVGRALQHLEDGGIIRRERRQASDTKRLSDRIILLMDRTFTVTIPDSQEAPDAEPDATISEGSESEGSKNEHSKNEQRERSKNEQRERSKNEQLKDNYPTNSGITSSGDGASAAQDERPGELAIPGIPPRAEVAIQGQQGLVADWVYQQIQGGLSRPALFKMAQAPLEHGYTANQIAKAMKAVWNMDRSLSGQTLARYLQGITRQPGSKPSTTDQRVNDTLALKEQLRARQAAQ